MIISEFPDELRHLLVADKRANIISDIDQGKTAEDFTDDFLIVRLPIPFLRPDPVKAPVLLLPVRIPLPQAVKMHVVKLP